MILPLTFKKKSRIIILCQRAFSSDTKPMTSVVKEIKTELNPLQVSFGYL